MKIKQLHADKKESFSLAVELENGLTVSLSEYLRALHARIEELERAGREVTISGDAGCRNPEDLPGYQTPTIEVGQTFMVHGLAYKCTQVEDEEGVRNCRLELITMQPPVTDADIAEHR